MTEDATSTQRLLRFLPGLVLLAFAVAGGAWALWFHDREFSALDNRYLAEFEYPTPPSLADKSWMDSFDMYVDERVAGRATWLELHAFTKSKVLRDPILNGVYVNAPQGHLLEKPMRQPYREELTDQAQVLTEAVEATGAEMLWVYAPRREEVFAEQLPEAWVNQYPERRGDIVEAFESTGASVLDLTDALADPTTRDANFFRTDHHWTVDGAMTATEAIDGELRELGVDIGVDDREYLRRSGPHGFLGSLGREVTLGIAQPEPFEYLEPEGGWQSRICSVSECGTSPFSAGPVEDPGKFTNRYLAWIGGDRGLTRLYNESPDASGTVVLIKDSYGNPVATYLGERVRNLYVIDERHYEGQALADLLFDISPDAVVTMHNQVSLLSRDFASDVWTEPGSEPRRHKEETAEVASYEGGRVATEGGLIFSSIPDQEIAPSLEPDSQALADALKPLGVPLSWLYLPRKTEAHHDLLTREEQLQVERRRQGVLDALDAHDVVDLTPALSNPALRDEYYYLTDHHPTPMGSRVIYESIVTQLLDQGVELGPEPDDWVRKTAEDPFAGSEIAVVPEQISTPLDDFWWWEPAAGWGARQCTAEVCEKPLVARSWIDDPTWDANKYRAFLGGGFEAIHLHNENAAVDTSVVMLKDSFSHYAAMLLSERVRDLYLVDERGWQGAPLATFVSDVDAAAVVVAHNPVTLLSSDFDLGVWANAGD